MTTNRYKNTISGMFFNTYCGNNSDTTRYVFDKLLNTVDNLQYTREETEWFAYCMSGLMSQQNDGAGEDPSDAQKVDAKSVTEPPAPPPKDTEESVAQGPPSPANNSPTPVEEKPESPSSSVGAGEDVPFTETFRMTIYVRRIGVEDIDLIDPFTLSDPDAQSALLMMHPQAISEDVIDQTSVPMFGDVIRVKKNALGQLVWTKITGDNNQMQFLKTMANARSINSQFAGAVPGLLGEAIAVKECPSFRTPPVSLKDKTPYSSGLWYATSYIIKNLSYHCKLWMDDFAKTLAAHHPSYVNSGKYIVVTSGLRSPWKQSEVMFDARYADRNLPNSQGWNPYSAGLGNKIFDEFKRAGWDNRSAAINAGEAKIKELQKTQGSFKGGHLGNTAVDLRTNGLSPEDVQMFIKVAKTLNAKTAILEKECRSGEHIHITIPKVYKGYEAGPTEKGEM